MTVGAGLLAKNDNAVFLLNRGACFASKSDRRTAAPTWVFVEGLYRG
jgi:hypothetical protein